MDPQDPAPPSVATETPSLSAASPVLCLELLFNLPPAVHASVELLPSISFAGILLLTTPITEDHNHASLAIRAYARAA